MQKEQKKVGMRNIEREKRDKQKISSTTEILIELALHACRLHENKEKRKTIENVCLPVDRDRVIA